MRAGEWALYVRKGLIAVAGALSQLGLALTPTSDGSTSVTAAEWVAIALAGLTAAGVVAFGNGPKPTAVDADGRHEA